MSNQEHNSLLIHCLLNTRQVFISISEVLEDIFRCTAHNTQDLKLRPIFSESHNIKLYNKAIHAFIYDEDLLNEPQTIERSSNKFFIQHILYCILYRLGCNCNMKEAVSKNSFEAERIPCRTEVPLIKEEYFKRCVETFEKIPDRVFRDKVKELRPVFTLPDIYFRITISDIKCTIDQSKMKYPTIDPIDYVLVKLYLYTLYCAYCIDNNSPR